MFLQTVRLNNEKHYKYYYCNLFFYVDILLYLFLLFLRLNEFVCDTCDMMIDNFNFMCKVTNETFVN